MGNIIPVLRDATVKFKTPTVKMILAYPSISAESREKFNSQLAKKGHASISVDVDIKDIENTVMCIATYNWFVQKIEN